MAIVIKPKRSETASSAPTVSDLAVGEIAINTADSKLYIRDSDDNIKSIGGADVIKFPYDDTDLGDLSYATQNSDLGVLGGLVSYPDGNYDNLTVHSSLTVNGTEITGSGIALTDLSVGEEGVASGDGAISYNSSTGVFTYTPPDLSSYLTSYTVTESDVTTHQAALSITESQISDLGTYLTSYTVTESDVTTHQAALSITESQISDLGTYLTTETNDLTASVTWANVPDVNITESSVTQHQTALSITESQISDLQSYLTSADLSTVATSGSYDDLSDTPTIPSITGLATETYVDTAVSNLVDTAPEALNTLNELAAALGDDANFATTTATSIGLKANTADLATVATTGAYSDLTGTPTLSTVATTGSYSDITGTPALATVATTGSYNDLSDAPTGGVTTGKAIAMAMIFGG